MNFIVEMLFILSVVLIVVLIFMRNSIPEKKSSSNLYVDKNNLNINECTASLCDTMSDMKKGLDNTLHLVSQLPKDYNDKQNLNNKYNKGTYRDEKGMFRSLKTTIYEELEY